MAKNALFQHIFQKKLTKHVIFFARLDEKRKLLGNFEKIFLRKLQKCIILGYFQKNRISLAWTPSQSESILAGPPAKVNQSSLDPQPK